MSREEQVSAEDDSTELADDDSAPLPDRDINTSLDTLVESLRKFWGGVVGVKTAIYELPIPLMVLVISIIWYMSNLVFTYIMNTYSPLASLLTFLTGLSTTNALLLGLITSVLILALVVHSSLSTLESAMSEQESENGEPRTDGGMNRFMYILDRIFSHHSETQTTGFGAISGAAIGLILSLGFSPRFFLGGIIAGALLGDAYEYRNKKETEEIRSRFRETKKKIQYNLPSRPSSLSFMEGVDTTGYEISRMRIQATVNNTEISAHIAYHPENSSHIHLVFSPEMNEEDVWSDIIKDSAYQFDIEVRDVDAFDERAVFEVDTSDPVRIQNLIDEILKRFIYLSRKDY